MDNKHRFFSDEYSAQTALYGQFYGDDHHAGRDYERKIYNGNKFPKTKKGILF
ncbi:hypothetical protein AB6H17_06940 [Proteus vulgaris]|uniref:hypothetical protein n=1 Tax=Proteus vulgaris TaxID=585 RepID=UPI0034DD2BB4